MTAQQQFSDARSGYRLRNAGVWAAIIVYVLSAADALFIHDTIDEINELPDVPTSPASLVTPPLVRIEVPL